MATIATLVVDMQANTAEFTKTWDATGDKVRKGSGAFKEAEKAALGFAKAGLGGIAAGVPGAERAIEGLMRAAFGARGGLLAMGGQLAIIVGGTLAVAAAVQTLRDLIREKGFGLESDEKRIERLNKEIEAEKKFLEDRQRSVNLLRDIERSRAQAFAEADAVRLKAEGDELGAIEATLQGRLQAIEQETIARTAQALEATKNTKDAVLRERLMTAIARDESAKQTAAYAQAQADRVRVAQEASVKVVETLQKESAALQEQINKAIATRQQISQAGSAAAQALNVSGITNLDKVRTFGQQLEAVAKKFHMLREEGVPYRDLSGAIDTATGELTAEFQKLRAEIGADAGALDMLDNVWRRFSFGDIRANIDNQRVAFENQGIALTQVNDLIARQRDLLQVELPEAARRAGVALSDLNTRIRAVESAFYAANVQMLFFEQTAASQQI
jgi:hypothetical protein